MQRDLQRLKTQRFDVIIIGAGVHGACIARDASMRGLSVALIDKGDLSSATSHNSLKTIHGGIRYLQHLNFKRTLECINEQKFWLQTAPHLVKPLPFLMPTYGHGARGPEAMWCGIKLYETLGIGRNRNIPAHRKIPKGKILTAQECLDIAPAIKRQGLTGGAVWYDAQAENTDRIVIELAQSAAMHDAQIANYVAAQNLIVENDTVIGITAQDQLTNEAFELYGNLVINAAGPWAAQLLSNSNIPSLAHHRLPLTKSMNIVTRKILPEHAIGVQSHRQSDSIVGKSKRLYFIVPWRDCSIIGTTHFRVGDNTASINQNKAETRMEIDQFIHEINEVYPDTRLALEDVIYCYQGLTPANDPKQHANATRLHHSKIIDHQKNDKLAGLISVVSIKWTTARLIAEKVTDLAVKKLSNYTNHFTKCQTRHQPLPGVEAPVGYLHKQSTSEDLIDFVNRAVNNEMARSLNDLLLRRTDAVMQNNLSAEQIKLLSQTLANRLKWDMSEKNQQLSQLKNCWLAPEIQQQLTEDFIWSEQ